MDFTMITPYHNHDWGYVALILKDFPSLPDTIEVDQKILFRKGEFHVSLMALKNLVPLISTVKSDITEDDLVQDFLDFQNTTAISEFELTGELRYVVRGERETVVAMVKVPHIDELFEQLRKKYEVDIPTQPTHITLYTLQPEAGIGIFSEDELNRDTKPVIIPAISFV